MPLPKPEYRAIPLGLIESHPDHVRAATPVKDQLLLRSIERWGIMTPLHVRYLENDRFQIVDGHRRFGCAAMQNLESVPCLVHTKLLKEDYAYLRFVLDRK